MNVRSLRRHWGKLGFAALFIATSVVAQPAPAPAPAAKPDAEVSFRKGSQLTPQEQMTQANAYITKMKSTEQNVARMAKKARRDKDIIKLNCVNDKLIQIKGNLNLGERTRTALQAATNNDAARNHEFAKLTIIYQKVVVLGQEAEACIGEDIAFVGATRVDVEVDPDITAEDPTEEPPPPPDVIRPPVASPFI